MKKTVNYGPGNGWTAESRLHSQNIGPFARKLLEIEHRYDIGLKFVTFLAIIGLCLVIWVIVR
jgi:hypothetical protein